MRADDLHGLSLETAELHEQCVLAEAARFLSVLACISILGRGGNLTLFHPAITSNTALIERMKHPDVTAMGSPSLTATQERAVPSPKQKASSLFHFTLLAMQSWPWPGFEQTPCGKLSMLFLC